MNILIIGSGGREHALAWKLAQSKSIEKIYVAPGNGGTYLEKKCENIDILPLQFEELTNFVETKKIDLTVVGPELPLSEGIVDFFKSKNLNIIGPNKDAAKIESSKTFAKALMLEAQIPTGSFHIAENYKQILKYIQTTSFPVVIKYDGLAQGKGVFIAKNKKDAEKYIDEIFIEKKFGENPLVILEEFLTGEEASYIVLTDGEHILPLATSQDHKQIYDNDLGPNTGGMGAYSPAPILEGKHSTYTLNHIIKPLINTFQKKGISYKGFIYAGLMITDKGIKVLEFNCRLGDPETQPILMRLENDLSDMFIACMNNTLNEVTAKWSDNFAISVVMASKGYPDKYEKGYEIKGLEKLEKEEDIKVFHSGTKFINGKIVTNGGRVLSVTAKDKTIRSSIEKVYKAIKNIDFKNAYFRTDIGFKALRRNKK
jgi:phosphoribosylamine--glycine ligase